MRTIKDSFAKNYDDNLEKIVTAIFGSIGIIAIIINLFLKGLTLQNFLDGIKDVAGLVVVIVVFLIASKIFSFNKKKKFNFTELFEELLLEWANLNKYLIDASEINTIKGKKNEVRTIDMICDHSLMVKCDDASKSTAKKGSFMYLPQQINPEAGENSDSNKIKFKINKSMFKNNSVKFDKYEEDKSRIADEISMSLKAKFSHLNLSISSNGELIIVDFSDLEKKPENAKELIDVVEFTKTVFLAIG